MHARDAAPADSPIRSNAETGIAFAALSVATVAMAALHVVQPRMDPIHEPVSFYVHGDHGWLLPIALGAFGAAALVLSRLPGAAQTRAGRRCLAFFGAGLVLTALLPSDRSFPWEHPPSFSGLVHAAIAMAAPLLLLASMFAHLRHGRVRAWQRGVLWLYVAALVASAGSLAIGFVRDGPPPWIGLAERLLALAAITWVFVLAWQLRLEARRGTDGQS